MEVVRAALGDDVHHAAVAAAVFGLVALRDEVELLDRLEREELEQAADGVVVVVAAVDLIVDVAAVAAADLRRVLRALGRIGVEAEADAGNRERRRFANCRPLSGRLSSRLTSTTPPTDDEEVWMSGVSARTVIVSDTAASLRVRLRSIVWPTLTTMPLFSTLLKPDSSAVRS